MSVADKILLFERTYDEINRKMPLNEGRNYKDEDVYIDFSKYKKCTFDNCTLILKFGITSLINCSFNKCTFTSSMGSPASAVVQIDRTLRETEKQTSDELEGFK